MRTSDFLLIIIKLIIFYSYKFICLFFKQIKCQSILLYLNKTDYFENEQT